MIQIEHETDVPGAHPFFAARIRNSLLIVGDNPVILWVAEVLNQKQY